MEDTAKLKTVVALIISIIIAVGFMWFGTFSVSNFKANRSIVEVKGLSERIVKSEFAKFSIKIENSKNNLPDLYKKRMADKEKVINFLKKHGIKDDEIVSGNSSTQKMTQRDNEGREASTGYQAFDTVAVKTDNIGCVRKIKEGIVNLSAEGLLVSFDYSYQFVNFQALKLDMLNEASNNARDSAVEFIKPYGKHIKDVVRLRQGEISIRAEDEDEGVGSWETQEKTSINKKVRLVVSATFNYD